MLLVAATLVGQILGFMRYQIINANFPATGPESTDAYFAAFKIPDFFFYTIAAGTFGVAFMPFLADKLAKGDKKSVWELTSSLLNLAVIVMASIGAFLFIFAQPLIELVISNNLSPQHLENATAIMKFAALSPLLFTVAGILTSLGSQPLAVYGCWNFDFFAANLWAFLLLRYGPNCLQPVNYCQRLYI